MNVFAYYDASLTAPSEQASLVTLWERSWRNHGWKPRLISARHAKRSSLYKKFAAKTKVHPLLAFQACGGGLLVPMRVMNLGFAPTHAEAKPRGTVDRLPFGIFRATGPAIIAARCSYNSLSSGLCAAFGTTYWTTAPLVFFSDPNKILTCGRSL